MISLAIDLGDSTGSVFEPDVVLPSEFYRSRHVEIRGGERRLMSALLSDGIEAYIAQCSRSVYDPHGGSQSTRGGNDDAHEWVHTRDYTYVFSFDNVCESLGIDAEYLRLGLRRYVDSIRQRRARGESVKSSWKKIRRPRK